MILERAIVSDLLSKLISDGVDISKTAIQNFVEGRYKPYQNLYSQIYKILVQVLHTITYHCYEKNPERIYEAAEILLREYRDHPAGGDGMSCVQACLCSLHSREQPGYVRDADYRCAGHGEIEPGFLDCAYIPKRRSVYLAAVSGLGERRAGTGSVKGNLPNAGVWKGGPERPHFGAGWF